MKKLFAILFMLSILLFSCQKEDIPNTNNINCINAGDVIGSWRVDKYFRNSIDETIQYRNLHQGYIISFSEFGEFSEFYIGYIGMDLDTFINSGTYGLKYSSCIDSIILNSFYYTYQIDSTGLDSVLIPHNYERHYGLSKDSLLLPFYIRGIILSADASDSLEQIFLRKI